MVRDWESFLVAGDIRSVKFFSSLFQNDANYLPASIRFQNQNLRVDLTFYIHKIECNCREPWYQATLYPSIWAFTLLVLRKQSSSSTDTCLHTLLTVE
jgi:hypothetical protein